MPLAYPLAFPDARPPGYAPLEREPVFDPKRHLALERPETVVSLEELGYGPEEIAGCPTTLGITSCFRVLSDEGVDCLLEVVRSLERFTTSNARIQRNVRGGTYRSRFLRDLCLSPDIADAISEICGAPMAPHTIPHQLGHLNYNPLDIGRSVDKWHVDTLRVDYVMFVTDPNAVEGGEFQYFRGTKHEMAALHEAGETPPEDRVVSPRLPGPGYAVLQQGNMVVHRARGSHQARRAGHHGERIRAARPCAFRISPATTSSSTPTRRTWSRRNTNGISHGWHGSGHARSSTSRTSTTTAKRARRGWTPSPRSSAARPRSFAQYRTRNRRSSTSETADQPGAGPRPGVTPRRGSACTSCLSRRGRGRCGRPCPRSPGCSDRP